MLRLRGSYDYSSHLDHTNHTNSKPVATSFLTSSPFLCPNFIISVSFPFISPSSSHLRLYFVCEALLRSVKIESMEPPPSKGELGTSPTSPSPTTPAPDSIDEKNGNVQEATSVSTAQPQDQDQDQDQEEDAPVHERWNSSPINVTRYLQTLLAFLVMGVSDASLGVSFST